MKKKLRLAVTIPQPKIIGALYCLQNKTATFITTNITVSQLLKTADEDHTVDYSQRIHPAFTEHPRERLLC